MSPVHSVTHVSGPDQLKVARPERFELPTLWFEARRSIQLSYGRTPCPWRDLEQITKE